MTDPVVFCNQCGQPVNAAASFCPRCGGTLTPTAPTLTQSGAVVSPYGGFWLRFVAYLIDSAVVNIALTPVIAIIMASYFAAHHGLVQDPSQGPDASFFVVVGLVAVLAFAGIWLYDAWMTSSSKQGTLGKMAFRMKVTDTQGARLSFAHATGRFFAKMISGFTMGIGYIMAGFTERKQALHDMIAGTLVMRN